MCCGVSARKTRGEKERKGRRGLNNQGDKVATKNCALTRHPHYPTEKSKKKKSTCARRALPSQGFSWWLDLRSLIQSRSSFHTRQLGQGTDRRWTQHATHKKHLPLARSKKKNNQNPIGLAARAGPYPTPHPSPTHPRLCQKTLINTTLRTEQRTACEGAKGLFKMLVSVDFSKDESRHPKRRNPKRKVRSINLCFVLKRPICNQTGGSPRIGQQPHKMLQ